VDGGGVAQSKNSSPESASDLLSLPSELRRTDLEDGNDLDFWLRKGGFQPGVLSASVDTDIETLDHYTRKNKETKSPKLLLCLAITIV